MKNRGTMAFGGDPSQLLASERSLTDVRYETNHFGSPVKVAGATVRFADFLLSRAPIDLPRGLREIVEIRRNHAAPGEAAA